MLDPTLSPDDLGATLQRRAPASGEQAAPIPTTASTRYRPGRELGRGGMGRVVEAVDGQFDRLVAVKELLGPLDASAAERFRIEALITGKLEHPGIPSVHEHGVDERGVPFYVMQRVAGLTLTECCKRAGSMRERLELIPAVLRVAQTVGFAHSRGVIHRDLKPDNVIVGTHGETYLLDWGIAKVKGVPDINAPQLSMPTQSGLATSAGAVMGTPAYMAPEQANGEVDRIDERTDVFALGAMLFHVLTGRPVYGGNSVNELLTQARGGQAPRLKQAAPEVPAGLREICDRALAAEPSARFPDADAFARALEAYTADSLGGARRTVDWLVNGFALVSGLLLVFACVIATKVMPRLLEQGPFAVVSLFIAVCGVAVALVELTTRSRYRLGGLVLLLAAVTFCVALGFSSIDALAVLHTIRSEPTGLSDGLVFRELLVTGAREALGGLPLSFLLIALQLLLLGVAQRRAPKS